MEPVEIILQSIQNNVKQVEVLSHNISNANTPGYQTQQVFSQYLGENGSVLTSTATPSAKGAVIETGRALDVASLNDGFFLAEYGNEQAITRNGRFHIDAEGMLKHASGAPVTGQNGPITLPNGNIRIDTQGNVYANEELVDSLVIVKLQKNTPLNAVGNGLYTTPSELSVIEPHLKQHSINGSSVSTSHDMVRLIEVSRHTQSLQKAAMAMDQIANAGINELGRR